MRTPVSYTHLPPIVTGLCSAFFIVSFEIGVAFTAADRTVKSLSVISADVPTEEANKST